MEKESKAFKAECSHKGLSNEENDSYKAFRSKQPVFFNKSFVLLNKITSFVFSVYVVITTLLYLAVRFSSESEIKGKAVTIEYDSLLLHNLLIVNTTLVATIMMNYYGAKYRQAYIFCYSTLVLGALYFGYVMNLKSENLIISEYIKFIKLALLTIIVTLTFYMIYYFLARIYSFRTYIGKNFSIDEVIHEISLRTDMLKFSYNHFMIRTKIHKYIPSLLYKRESFYYTTCTPKSASKESFEPYSSQNHENVDEDAHFLSKDGKQGTKQKQDYNSRTTNYSSTENN